MNENESDFLSGREKLVRFIEARTLLIEFLYRVEELDHDQWFWSIKKYVQYVVHLAREAGWNENN